MFHAGLGQPVAGGEPGLAGTNDHGIWGRSHGGILRFRTVRGDALDLLFSGTSVRLAPHQLLVGLQIVTTDNRTQTLHVTSMLMLILNIRWINVSWH
ncbi:hypothetical protein GCM10010523_17700 [Paenarthrobacter ilicis]